MSEKIRVWDLPVRVFTGFWRGHLLSPTSWPSRSSYEAYT